MSLYTIDEIDVPPMNVDSWQYFYTALSGTYLGRAKVGHISPLFYPWIPLNPFNAEATFRPKHKNAKS